MDLVLHHAEAVLRRHPAPALRLSELLREVRAIGSNRVVDARLMRSLLEAHSERFRILDPWRGPWRLARGGGPKPEQVGDPWVVLITDPGGRSHDRPDHVARLRESVRWVARGVDARSPRHLIRWHAMVLAECRTREVLERRAA